jgi:hypothetical protein
LAWQRIIITEKLLKMASYDFGLAWQRIIITEKLLKMASYDFGLAWLRKFFLL